MALQLRWRKPPLPYIGNKAKWLNIFAEQILPHFQHCTLFVDCFGGSGLLSRTVKDVFPQKTVVYNDFGEHYRGMLSDVATINEIISAVYDKIKSVNPELLSKKEIQSMPLFAVELLHELCSVANISNWYALSCFLYPMRSAETKDEFLRQKKYIKNFPQYDCAGYLDGLILENLDFRELHKKYKDGGNVCFILDPPYLSTQTEMYYNDRYFHLSDYCDVLGLFAAENIILFTSEKSAFEELDRCFSKLYNAQPLFKDFEKVGFANRCSAVNADFQEFCYYKTSQQTQTKLF